MFGYNGKLVYINLTDKSVEVKDLDPKMAEEFIGGAGLSAKLTHDLLSDQDYETLKKDPLDGINPLIFSTGPLTGTATPSSGRYCVTGISPLTGYWGESTSGGFLPVVLRRCGYDAIIITGKASEQTYIYISEGNVEFKSASNIWGEDTRATIELIKKELSSERVKIACIGKGGERKSNYAAIINDEGRAAGRCGLGAVMGSKNLKALAVTGGNKIEYADREGLIKLGKDYTKTIMNFFQSIFISHYGSACYTDIGMVLGDIPAKYFTSTEFKAEYLTGRALKEEYPVIHYGCAGCSIKCGRTTYYEKDGVEIEIDGPEYETIGAFGPLCGIEEWGPILEANHACNLEGIDTISTGVSIAFLIYLIENNIGVENVKKHLDDIKVEDIKWGNNELVVKLVDKIINRNGIGNLLADGVKIMAEKLEVDPELAAHVKGLEIPMHEPRAYKGQALSYMTSCCGAHHKKGEVYGLDGEMFSMRGFKKDDRFIIDGREKVVVGLQDVASVYDSAVICSYTGINIPILGKFLKLSTGFNSLANRKKFFLAAERGTQVKRLISCKLGLTREDDKLPKLVTQPLKSGATAGVELNLEENLKEYYKLRGWDWETGCPTKEKLEQLGI